MKTRKLLTLFSLFLFSLYGTSQSYVWEKIHDHAYPTGIVFDSDDSLWYVIQGGGLFEKSGSSTVDHSTGLITVDVVSCEMSSDILWTGGYGGLSELNAGTYSTFTTPVLSGYAVYDVDFDGTDVWLAMETEGASHYDGTSWTHYMAADGIAGGWHTCIEVGGSGNVWLGSVDFSSGSEGVVNFFDGSSWSSYASADGVTLSEITSIMEDSNGDIWIGGDGVMRFDGTSWTDIPVPGLTNNVYSIDEDAFGNLWFGEISGGIYMYDGSTVQDMSAPMNFGGRPEGIAGSAAGIMHFCLSDGIYTCVDTTVSLGVDPSDFGSTASSISLFPNPAVNDLTISKEDIGKTVLFRLLDNRGKEILKSSIPKGDKEVIVNTEGLAKGIYFIEIDGWEFHKFMKI